MEEEFFLKKMRGVTPLKKEKKAHSKNTEIKKNITNEKKTNQKKTINTVADDKEINKSYFNISFGDINKDLKRGKVKIDRRLDLHGYTLLDAYEVFKKEVKKTYNNNKRCLLVITGKGVYLNKKKADDFIDAKTPKLFHGKIKNSIISWINEEELKRYILTYQNAGIEHGGEGAIFVYLRKKNI